MSHCPLTRRQLLKRTAIASTLMTMPTSLLAQERKPLIVPQLIEVGRGKPVLLDIRPIQVQLKKGVLTEMWGTNGHYPAPTVKVRSGRSLKLMCNNNLNEDISFNIQGLATSTEAIGSAHRILSPKSSWSPIINIEQSACTAFYHANTMLNSAPQLAKGIAGIWIIEDEESRKSPLPQKYGVNDLPLILQDQQLDDEGQLYFSPTSSHFLGKTLLINGQPSAYHDVPRGWVRLRLVNASVSRVYQLSLDNDQPLHLIASGVGMLAQPLPIQTLTLAPAQRAEVLVDLNEGKNVSLISGQKRGVFYQVGQLFENNDELIDNVILELRPTGMAAMLNQIPALVPFNQADFHLNISAERAFNINPSDALINQQRFDPNRIDFSVKQGSVERWYLQSSENIGFMLQGAKFVVETQNKQKMPYKQLMWQDVVWLEKDQITTILVRFDQPTFPEQPFNFGVSDFLLRDKGAMGQFNVVSG